MKKRNLPSFEEIIVAIDLLLMLALIFLGVVSRKLLHFSFSFTEELVCAGSVLLATMGGALASKNNAHYTLDLAASMMKPKTKKIFLIINTGLTSLAAFVLFKTSVTMVMSQIKIGSVSTVLRVPSWVYGVLVPIGLIFVILRSIEFIVKALKTDADKPEEEGEAK